MKRRIIQATVAVLALLVMVEANYWYWPFLKKGAVTLEWWQSIPLAEIGWYAGLPVWVLRGGPLGTLPAPAVWILMFAWAGALYWITGKIAGRLWKFAWLLPALCYVLLSARMGYLTYYYPDSDAPIAYVMLSLPSSLVSSRLSDWATGLIWGDTYPPIVLFIDFLAVFIFGLAQYLLLGFVAARGLERFFIQPYIRQRTRRKDLKRP